MGNLLSVLGGKNGAERVDLFLDFENAQPTDAEKEVYDATHQVLNGGETILKELKEYTGAGEAIRQAISHPGKEADDAAWAAVCPLVLQLKGFYEYSSELERVLPMLLKALCTGNPLENLEQKQALGKQFAQILHFVLNFDDLKMTNPAIQNDFSYYRRTLSRMKMSNAAALDDVVVRDEVGNRMSLFYAYPTPMLKCLSDATDKFVRDNKAIPVSNITDALATMAAVCQTMVDNPEYSGRFADKENTTIFCLRVMVGTIILYDHQHPSGAFSKKNSKIDIRGAIKVLRDHPGKTDGLINALKYTTVHLNDDDTPKQIKALLN